MIAPILELPVIRWEGYTAMLRGMSLRATTYPLGFAFCPYKIGSTERINFLVGACAAVFGTQ